MSETPPAVSQLLDLHGKVALVTGAAANIGAGIARRLAEAGAAVAIHTRSGAARAKDLAAGIGKAGGRAIAVEAELTRPEDVDKAVEAVTAALGPIDILVNNAARQTHAPFETMELDEWRGMLADNLDGVFIITKRVTAQMIARKSGGAIVNIASIAAHRWTGIAYASYYATKGAVVSLTRAIALEYAGKGIRCNSVSPGLMDTPMVRYGLTSAYGKNGDVDNLIRVRTAQCPMGHMGTGWDTAHAVLFLASDEAKYVTGIDLIVDGGLTAKFA
jgi:NAD(P)-dependent dehydrogenase (short-subunit alcohol dehydrogenase family)